MMNSILRLSCKYLEHLLHNTIFKWHLDSVNFMSLVTSCLGLLSIWGPNSTSYRCHIYPIPCWRDNKFYPINETLKEFTFSHLLHTGVTWYRRYCIFSVTAYHYSHTVETAVSFALRRNDDTINWMDSLVHNWRSLMRNLRRQAQ